MDHAEGVLVFGVVLEGRVTGVLLVKAAEEALVGALGDSTFFVEEGDDARSFLVDEVDGIWWG
jgi:hypothetical protein